MLLGLVGSFPPLYFSIMNGFLLGSFTYNFSLESSLAFTVTALIPHGIVEIPTILLSSRARRAYIKHLEFLRSAFH